MLETYKVNGQTKYWKTGASAVRNAIKLNAENNFKIFYAPTFDQEKGWFLENLHTA